MSKRKLLLLAVSLCMVAILAAGTTLAYLTDTESLTNTFTTGNVSLTLDEALVEKNEETGDFEPIDKENKRTEEGLDYEDYGKVYPGNKIAKDPTITLGDSSEPSYVAAKITVTKEGLHDLIGLENYPNLDITQVGVIEGEEIGFITGGLLKDLASATPSAWTETDENGGTVTVSDLPYHANDTCHVYQDANKAGEGVWVFYVYIDAIQEKGEKIVLFESINIPDSWENDDMTKLNGMKIDVEAYAVQADGFANCYEAMTTAFAGTFSFE